MITLFVAKCNVNDVRYEFRKINVTFMTLVRNRIEIARYHFYRKLL